MFLRNLLCKIKRYKDVSPPIHDNRVIIVLTGGPGGGKTTFIEDLRRKPEWKGRLVFFPEAIAVCSVIGISPTEKIFQKIIVHTQIALEDGLKSSLDPSDPRIFVCHRGSLDPLAYWIKAGWAEDEFFDYIGMTREEHYSRYDLVLHLTTAAIGVPERYKQWPYANRNEDIDDATLLDRILERIWHDHRGYHKLENDSSGWESKSTKVMEIMRRFLIR